MTPWSVRPVAAADCAELVRLFERNESPCFCRYWHFAGDSDEWLDRCANRPSENRDELTAALFAGDLVGVVAQAGSALVGWMKIAPARSLPKLYEQRMFKGLPCFSGPRADVWAVGCFLVDEPFRGRRVADSLLAGGLELAAAHGAKSVEAFPRRAEGVPAEQLWTGPFSIYERAGFRVVTELCPYPVLRLDLAERP